MAGWTRRRSPSGSCGNKLFFPGWELSGDMENWTGGDMRNWTPWNKRRS